MYHQKYLKYKHKYFGYKNMYGGTINADHINDIILKEKINTSSENEKIKSLKFDYSVTLDSDKIYEKIYFIILYTYYGSNRENDKYMYILNNIKELDDEQKKNIYILLLNMLIDKYLVECINYSFYDKTEPGYRESLDIVKKIINMIKTIENFFNKKIFIDNFPKYFEHQISFNKQKTTIMNHFDFVKNIISKEYGTDENIVRRCNRKRK